MIQGIFNQKGFLITPHCLINFEIQNCYWNKPRVNGIYSRDNLPNKIEDGGTCNTSWLLLWNWNSLDCFVCIITYFDPFRVEHIPKEIEKFIGNKNIKTNIFRIQAYDSVMCGYFCIGFIDFMVEGKNSTDFTNKHVIYIQIWKPFLWMINDSRD